MTSRAEYLLVFESAYEQLSAVLEAFPQEMWNFKATPDGWCIHDILIHIMDSEINGYFRCRRLIAEPGSEVPGYDESAWAANLYYPRQSTEEALETFRLLRKTTSRLLHLIPESTWANTVTHSESGAMTLDNWLQIYADHIPAHIAQMNEVFTAWQASQ